MVYGPEGYDFPGGVKYLPFAALLIGEAFSFLGYALWAWYVLVPVPRFSTRAREIDE